MRWLPDTLAVVAGSLLTVGVYLEFGLGYALIVAGLYLAALAVNAARLMNASNHNETDQVGR